MTGALDRIGSRGGQGLPDAVRARMERAFGKDLGHVRVHTDAAAARAAQVLNAWAFTTGSDIYFNQGAFSPGTPAGDELLAHELTHVIQADEGRLPSSSSSGELDVSSPSDAHEREAVETGRQVARQLAAGPSIVAEATGPLDAGLEVGLDAAGATMSAGVGGGLDVAQDSSDAPASTAEASASVAQRDAQCSVNGTAEDDELRKRGELSTEKLAALEDAESCQEEVEQEETEQDQADQAGGEQCVEPEATDDADQVPTQLDAQAGTEEPAVDPDASQDALACEDPSLTTSSSDTSPQGSSGSQDSSAIEEHMNSHGPQTSTAADAASELLNACWETDTDALASLEAYSEGGEGCVESAGVQTYGNALDSLLTGVTDRGDSALAQETEKWDQLRQVASTVGSIAGTLGLACSIGSLIGLFPPAAPVGAVLATVGEIAGGISLVAGIVTTVASTMVSVNSALMMIEAVYSGSSDALSLYDQYQMDVGRLTSDGINSAVSLALLGVGRLAKLGSAPKTANLNKAREALNTAQSAANGNVARNAADRGLRLLNPTAGQSFLFTKGNTAAKLINDLAKQVQNKTLLDGVVSTVVNSARVVGEVANNSIASNTIGKATAFTTSYAVPESDQNPTSTSDRLWSTLFGDLRNPFSTASPTPDTTAPCESLPTPEHSPLELDQIHSVLEQFDAARSHLDQVGIEGQSAIDGGEQLMCSADDHQLTAEETLTATTAHQQALQTQASELTSGEGDVCSALDENQQGQQEVTSSKDQADQQLAEANSQQVPQATEQSLWEKFKGVAITPIRNAIQSALDSARQYLSDLILQLLVGEEELASIKAQLEDMRTKAQAAQEDNVKTQESSSKVADDAAIMMSQASQAQSDAQCAMDQGQTVVDEVDAQETQLDTEEQTLQTEAEEVEAYCEDYVEQSGDGSSVDGSTDSSLGIDAGLLSQCRSYVADVRAQLDSQEGVMCDVLSSPGSMDSGGFDVFLDLWLDRQDDRYGLLEQVCMDLDTVETMPAEQAHQALEEMGVVLDQVTQSADQDARAVADGSSAGAVP